MEMAVIRVYVDDYCLGCKRAEELVQQLLADYPHLNLSTVNVAHDPDVPESLFALPTWYVDGEVWMLGNPFWSELLDLVRQGCMKA